MTQAWIGYHLTLLKRKNLLHRNKTLIPLKKLRVNPSQKGNIMYVFFRRFEPTTDNNCGVSKEETVLQNFLDIPKRTLQNF